MLANVFHALRTEEGQVQFWGAFFAALFSLATLGIAKAATGVFRRKNRHYNALVLLETELNRHVARMHDITYVIEGTLNAHKNTHVSWNNLDSLRVEPVQKYDALVDVDLINALFSYDNGLTRLNDDTQNLSKTYSELRTALISGLMKPEQFFSFLGDFNQNLAGDLATWRRQLEEAIDIAAQVRLMIARDRTWLLRVKLWIVRLGMKPLAHKAVKNERDRLMGEIEATQARSRKEIEEVLGSLES